MNSLLMGGQACVLYGAAEFSRDLDLVILLDSANLVRLESALIELEAVPIAVPPFFASYLAKGHAVHFRCLREDVHRLRIDVMCKMRGVAEFASLWARRTTVETDGVEVDLLGIEDLVAAKKTQRDKDWPMIRKLLEQHYRQNRSRPTEEAVQFWLREMRTPELLNEVMRAYPEQARKARAQRPALNGDLETSLRVEEDVERSKDREYWKPLREELEQLRFQKKSPAAE